MKKVLFSLLTAFAAIGAINAQDHFTTVWSGNGYDHMNIYVYSATLDNQQLEPGDEIAVFDQDRCVGYAVVSGTISQDNPVEIRASKDDPTTTGVTDGFVENNPLQFRVWDASRSIEASNVFRTFSFGTGNFIAGGSATVSLSAFSPNTAPAFVSSPVTSATEDELYTYTVEVEDPDLNANIRISRLNIPGWLTLIDNGDGTAKLTGIPKNRNVGSHDIVLIATDGIINTPIQQSFSITVTNVNDEPVISTVPKTNAQEGVQYQYDITALDPDNASVTLTATAKPDWLTFTAGSENTASLSGTPAQSDVGTHNVTITASDGTASVTQSFVITVKASDNEPQITTTSLPMGSQGESYSASLEFVDVDSETLTIKLLKAPPWLLFEESSSTEASISLSNQKGTVTLVGLPPVPRNFQIIVGYADASVSKQAVFELTINDVNDPPQARSYRDTLLEDKLAFVGLAGFDQETANNLLTFNIITPPSHGTLTKISKVFYRYQPERDYNGNDTIQYAVFDDGVPVLSDTGTIVLTIKPTNDRPSIAIANPRITMEENDSIEVQLQLTDDSDTTSLAVVKAFGPFNGRFEGDSLTGEYTYIPRPDFVGTDVIFLRAKELYTPEQLLSEPLMVQIRVTNVNASPVAFARSVNLREDMHGTFRLFAFDQEDDLFDLTLQIIDQPKNADSISISGNQVTYIPQADYSGKDSLTYRAEDLNGAFSDTVKVNINIFPVNDRPVAVLDTVVRSKDQGNLLTIDFSEYISDAELSSNQLDIEFVLKKQGYSGRGIFGGTLTQGTKNVEFVYDASTNVKADSTDYIIYRVSDGVLKSEPVTLIVMTEAKYSNKSLQVPKNLKANGSAEPTAYGDSTSVNFGEEIEVYMIGIDNDSTGQFNDTLDIEVIEPPKYGRWSFDKGLKASSKPGVPTTTASGIYAPTSTGDAVIFDEVKFKVASPSGEDDTSTVKLLIVKTNAKPTIDDIPNQVATEDQVHSMDITFEDLDDSTTVKWHFTSNSEDSVGWNHTIKDNNTVNLQITPPANYSGNLTVTAECSDDSSSATDDFILQLQGVNDAPELKKPENQAIFEGEDLSLLLYADDVDSDSLSYQAAAKTTASVESISFEDNLMTITPKAGFIGEDSVYVTVSDNESTPLTDREGFVLKVAPADSAPLLADIADKSLDEDNDLNISVSPTDTDTSETLTMNVSSSNQGLIPDENISVDVKAAKSGVTRSISITPVAEAHGEGYIFVKVTDDQGNQTVKTFKITVNSVDDPPSFDEISDVTMKEEGTTVVILSASDIDSDNLSYSAQSGNNNLNASLNGSELTLKGAKDFYGNVAVTISVEDATTKVSDVINVTVQNVNDTAEFTSQPVTNAEVGTEYSYKVTFSDPDADDNFSLTGTTKPDWLSISGNTDGSFTLSGTPASGDKGANDVVLTLDDGTVEVQQSFTITVGGVGIDRSLTAENVQVYPNPSSGSFEVRLVNQFQGKVELRIFDVSGKLVHSSTIHKNAGNQIQKIDLKEASQGYYTIQIIGGDKRINKKLLIK